MGNCNCGSSSSSSKRCRNCRGRNGSSSGGSGGAVLLWGNAQLQPAETVEYLDPGYSGTSSVPAPTIPQIRAPRSGTLRNMRVRQIPGSPPGLLADIAYRLRVNGVATALVVNMTSADTLGQVTVNVTVPDDALLDVEVEHGDFGQQPPQAVTVTFLFD